MRPRNQPKRTPAASGSAAASTPTPELTEIKLPNGLRVLVLPQPFAKAVALQAWVGVGSADETADEAGMAHVFEHMLFKGTERQGVGALAREIEGTGGSINAWTSFDQTVFHVVLPGRDFGLGIELLADALLSPALVPEELERERKVVLEEIKQGQDSPGRAVTQGLFATAFTKHPYRLPVIGTPRSVARMTRQALLAFHRKWYRGSNVTLMIVGDVDPTKIRPTLLKHFGALPKGPAPRRAERKEPAQKAPRVVVSQSRVGEAHFAIGFHAPGLGGEDTPSLDLIAALLAQGESSRLSEDLKRRRRLVHEIYAYTYTPAERGLFVVGGTTAPEQLQAAVTATLEEIYAFAHSDPSWGELAKVRTGVEADAIYQRETVQGLARALGTWSTMGGDPAREQEYLARVRSLTPTELRAAAIGTFKPENVTISVVIPDKGAPTQTRAALLKTAKESAIRVRKRFASSGAMKTQDGVVRHVLPNGLRLIVLKDPSVPLVAVRAVWEGGLRDEDVSRNGITHMLAALLPRGSNGRTGDVLAREIEGFGGSISGFSGRNSFGLRMEVLADRFDEAFLLMADTIVGPTFPEEEVERERRQILADLRAAEDSAGAMAFKIFQGALFGGHPYGLPLAGTDTSVPNITRELLARHYAERYPLSELTLAVVGDVDPDRVLRLVQEHFGAAPTIPPVAPEPPDAQFPTDGPVERFWFMEREQAYLVLGFPGVDVKDKDRHALDVMQTIMGGQSGRLFDELREKRGLAYQVGAVSVEGRDPGYFAVYVATSPEKVPEALAVLQAELARLRDERVPAEELRRAKRGIAGGHDMGLQRRGALASTMALNEVLGLGYTAHLKYAAAVEKVDAAAIQRVAARILDPKRAVLVTVRPPDPTPEIERRSRPTKRGKGR